MIEYTNTVITTVTNKPVAAFLITQTSFGISLLSWIGFLTPIIGFVAAIFGLVVGYYSARTAIRKWRIANRKKIHPKKDKE